MIDMSSIPELFLQDGTSNEQFNTYFAELKNSLSKFKTVRNRELRVTNIKKVEKEVVDKGSRNLGKIVTNRERLRFVPLNYKEFKVTAFFDGETNYLLGFLTIQVDFGDGSRGRICYIILENTENTEDKKNKFESAWV